VVQIPVVQIPTLGGNIDAVIQIPNFKVFLCRADDAGVPEVLEADQPESAFLLLRRRFSEDMLKVGSQITVTVEVYNAGERYE